jgi:hypothetical protein
LKTRAGEILRWALAFNKDKTLTKNEHLAFVEQRFEAADKDNNGTG